MKSGSCSVALFLGRLCLCAIFLIAGFSKLVDPAGTSQFMASKGMTMIPLFLFGAAAVEIVGGLSLLLGYKTRFGATILLLFLIPTTIIFHNFWAETDKASQANQLVNFLKNLGIFGGLLYILCFGAGRLSIDNYTNPSPPKA